MIPLLLVNEVDEVIGLGEKMQVHLDGLMHRAFSIFIFRDKEGQRQLLLQQRAEHKYHSGGLWSNTCCGHPEEGKTIMECAEKRLMEEMGIACTLEPHGSFHYRVQVTGELIENEIDHLFVGYFEGDEIPFNPDEVQAAQWVSWEAVQQDLIDNPEYYTKWFKPAVDALLK